MQILEYILARLNRKGFIARYYVTYKITARAIGSTGRTSQEHLLTHKTTVFAMIKKVMAVIAESHETKKLMTKKLTASAMVFASKTACLSPSSSSHFQIQFSS